MCLVVKNKFLGNFLWEKIFLHSVTKYLDFRFTKLLKYSYIFQLENLNFRTIGYIEAFQQSLEAFEVNKHIKDYKRKIESNDWLSACRDCDNNIPVRCWRLKSAGVTSITVCKSCFPVPLVSTKLTEVCNNSLKWLRPWLILSALAYRYSFCSASASWQGSLISACYSSLSSPRYASHKGLMSPRGDPFVRISRYCRSNIFGLSR